MQEFAQALPEGMFSSGFVSKLKFARRFFLAEDAHILALHFRNSSEDLLLRTTLLIHV